MIGVFRGKVIANKGLVRALLVSNAASCGLLLARILATGYTRYWFLVWNLLLGWLPLLFAYLLVKNLRLKTWRHPENLLLTVLWLVFLPNSFYLVTDLIHLHLTGEVNILYDAVMFVSFIFNSYVGGFLSLFLVHKELLRRIRAREAHFIVAAVLVVSSFAIYLGRALRWNTWDILVNPAGLLFDVSEQVINPLANPQSIVTTVSFFVLLGSVYMVIWQLATAFRPSRK